MSPSNPTFAAGSSSRRQFLKQSGVLAGSAMAGLAISRSAHAAGSDTLKVGLIGCGGRGSGAAANALNADPNAKLVAMADAFRDKVLASRAGLAAAKPAQVAVDDDHCFAGFDGYRKVIDSGVDVVLIACASKFHPHYLKAAVDAGKHVFIEKPHGVNVPDLKLVTEACATAQQKGLSVVSGLCWRYHRGVQETIGRVLDGAIGDVVAIRETYARSPYRIIERQPNWSEMEWQVRNWYHFRWLSGGDILQSLVHSLDKASWIMHDKPPAAAWGVGGRSGPFTAADGDQLDHQAIVYEYANGVELYGFSRDSAGCYNETSDHIFGTKGRCDLLKYSIKGETNWQYDGPDCNMYDAEHVALFGAIRAGKPINNSRYMVLSTMLGIIGRMAACTGKRITWQQALSSKDLLGPADVSFDIDPPVKPGAHGTYPVPVPGVTPFS
jgi:myo-inositol 2-dehydrogenase/D-chiro-inositol 1-dehydrogenase